MAFNIEIEEKRHLDGWGGFVRFTIGGSAAVVLALVLMALFLL